MTGSDARRRTPSISELQAALRAARNGRSATGATTASPRATVALGAADSTPGGLDGGLLDVGGRRARGAGQC